MDVFLHASKEAVDSLIQEGYTVTQSSAADMNPRVALPASMGKDGKPGFAYLKACQPEILEKLYIQQG